MFIVILLHYQQRSLCFLLSMNPLLLIASLVDFSSTHALKSRTDIIIKGSRLYVKHNTFTEVCLQFISHYESLLFVNFGVISFK